MVRFNEKKALAAILYLAHKVDGINLHVLLDALFLAEKRHFQQWGRTITGDTFRRLPEGPVPARAYEMLRSVRGDGLWRNDLSAYFFFDGPQVVRAKRPPELECLSQTDVEMLDRSLSAEGDPACGESYGEAEKNHASSAPEQAFFMTEDDLAENDPILIAHLREARENERFLQNWRYVPPRDEKTFCQEGPRERACGDR